jgi:hypothetical protein
MHRFGVLFEGSSVWIPGAVIVGDTPALGRWIRREREGAAEVTARGGQDACGVQY